MQKSRIFQVALPVPLRRLFDYLPPPEGGEISRGTRVKVPFGKKFLTGIVIHQVTATALPLEQLKPITQVYEPFALFPEELCRLIEKTARYYHHPIGEVAFTGTPAALRQGKAAKLKEEGRSPPDLKSAPLALNTQQQQALEAIKKSLGQFQPFLLEGVTGSGKTEVYLQASEQILQAKQQVLILVPEISLTPQTLHRFQTRFGEKVVSYHSRMTPAKRWQTWLKVRDSKAQVVIGTRSAIFLPFVALGLIVIDEEHESSFKQQEGFRYSARDVAVLRAQALSCPIVLGSATPSFESLYNVQNNKYQRLYLPQRALSSQLPEIVQLDIRHKKLEGGLSAPLLQAIEQHLQQDGQVLLFINRRGFAPTFMCYHCSWIAKCQRCDARLTFHQKIQALICHHCTHQRKPPLKCPDCGTQDLHPVGHGTERLEALLQEKFPPYTLARIDSDATRKKGSLEELLLKAQNKEAQLLIGTQILAKGHHFPHLTMVAIIDADAGLFSVDFRAIEKMAQLIIQVAGRAGRVHEAGKVFIQTCQPHHPLLHNILRQDYHQLAQLILKERAECALPPYSYLALIRAHSPLAHLPQALLQEVQAALLNLSLPHLNVLGPVTAPMLKRQGHYRFQLLLQAPQRTSLHQALSYSTSILEKSKLAKRVRWSLDVDPLEMF